MHKPLLAFAITLLLVTSTLSVTSTSAQQNQGSNYPPKLDGAKVEVYKTIDDVELNIYIFAPEGHDATDKAPAIVFFFGGGWRSGNPKQFHEHCKYLASRGMVAMTADYRVLSRHGTKAVKCVADGKSAIRWVRANSERLGVDPNRIAAGGGSAGGHVAAATGTISEFDEEGEDLSISSIPDAMVLFNPATVLAPVKGQPIPDGDRLEALKERLGVELEKLSPFHNVAEDAPPTIIFHGKADTTVPYQTVELFAEAMTKAGNDCKLVGFEDRGHGFFNFGRDGGGDYRECVRQMDQFLIDLGYLDGEPTIE